MAPKKPPKVAYAVFIGRTPGVYYSWHDANRQVHGFGGNKYRGFTNAEGGEHRARNEYNAYRENLRRIQETACTIQRRLQDEETGSTTRRSAQEGRYESQDSLPSVEDILVKGTLCSNSRSAKRKRAFTGEEELSLEHESFSDDDNHEPVLGSRSMESNATSTAGPNLSSSSIVCSTATQTKMTALGSSSDENVAQLGDTQALHNYELDFISLGSADNYSEDEYDDAAIDEYIVNNSIDVIPTPKVTEPPLCKEQADLVSIIMSGQNTFYTGSAGCGKSTVLKAFVGQLKAVGKDVKIVAPTGRAALDINGWTTWTYAGWTPDHMKRPLKELCQAAHGKFIYRRFKQTDVLVIDEISMLENHHFERLNQVMKSARGSSQAFGGVQVVVTGDFCQLPPIQPFRYCLDCGETLRSDPQNHSYSCDKHGTFLDTEKWAFKSGAWQECNFRHVNLTTIHRQKDLQFIHILEKCRLGKPLSKADEDLLIHHKSETNGAVQLFTTRDRVRELNSREFARLNTPIWTFNCLDEFKWNTEHGKLRSKTERLPDGRLSALNENRFEASIQLRKGMLVVLLVNLDLSLGLVNGSQGVIVDFVPYSDRPFPEHVGEYKDFKRSRVADFMQLKNPGQAWPVVRFTNGVEQAIFAHCTLNELGDTTPYSLLSRTQIPLIAAWAMTVHKSQGMTLSKVVVDLARSFEAGQEYVALSRAKSLDGLKVLGLGNLDRGGNKQVMEFLNEKFGIS